MYYALSVVCCVHDEKDDDTHDADGIDDVNGGGVRHDLVPDS